MASGLHGHKLPNVRTWAHAERRFNQTAPVRGQDPDTRPLTENRSDRAKLLVRYERNGRVEYACRYHNTDCFTFRGDGTIHLIPWRSRNTDVFVGSILGLNTMYNHACGMCVELWTPQNSYIIYRLSEAAASGYTITEETQHRFCTPEVSTQPLYQYAVERQRANAVYKAAGLTPFGTWVKAALRLAPHAFVPSYGRAVMDVDALTRIQDPDQWSTLAAEYGPAVVARARETLIQQHGECITRTAHAFVYRGTIDTYHASATKYESAYDRAVARAKHEAWLARSR